MTLYLDGVGVTYGSQVALERIDLVVPTGSTLTVLGPSGSGKSTLLRAIAGLEATTGRVRWDEEDLTRTPTHRRGVGMVFQDHALLPHRDVIGNVRFGLEGRGRNRRAATAHARDLLARVGLRGYDTRRVTSLSGGEAQRVALARALAPSPRVLLLDEPYGALDRELRDGLMVEVRELLRDAGITTVHVTHDHDEALRLGDRMAILAGGRLVQCDEPARVWARPMDLATARFLGATSVIDGVVRPKGRRLDSPLGRIDLPAPRPPGPVTIAWRPEALQVDATGPILGRVLDHDFRRHHHVLRVSVAGHVVDAIAASPRPRGTPVRLRLDATAVFVYER